MDSDVRNPNTAGQCGYTESQVVEAWRVVGDVFPESQWLSDYTVFCPECRGRQRRGHNTTDHDKTRLALHYLWAHSLSEEK